MSRSPDEFEMLQKLLALKRHEQPPPGYFNHFADRVIAQLEAEGARPSLTWWQRCWEVLTAPPAVALSYGAVVLGVGTLGVLLLQSLERESDGGMVAGQSWPAVQAPEAAAIAPLATAQHGPTALESVEPVSSFSPVLGESAPPFLFNPNGARPVRVNYSPH
jgi:hypothetical protein